MTTPGSSPPCVALPWDSDFFGVSVARVGTDTLDDDRAAAIEAHCAAHRIDWVYFVARADDRETVLAAQRHDYLLVDVRVTFERLAEPRPEAPAEPLRRAEGADLPALRSIAREAHKHARYYFDPRVPRARCDALYERWITVSVEGWADHVLVGGPPGEPAGYVTCHLDRERSSGSIGLIAVGEGARGRGLGRALVDGAVRWIAEQGARQVTVVTHGRNIAAHRLYQRAGFVTRDLQLYYHKWFANEGAK